MNATAEALRHWEPTTRLRKMQCHCLTTNQSLTMKRLKPIKVKSISSLSREQMALITGGVDDRFYTSCTVQNAGQKCIYEGQNGVCDYTETRSSTGEVLYYDTFCKV